MPPATTPDLTVIVPAYNVELWLGASLSSLEHQTMRSWTAIVVIDGATDRSEEIALGYAARDDRFEVVVTLNRGVGHARNVGLDHATTEFVFFLDADDLLPPEALSVLSRAMTADTDLVAGIGEDLYADGSTGRYWAQRSDLFLMARNGLSVENAPAITDDLVAWGKLYRRRLIEDHRLRFPVGVHCEDLLFAAETALCAQSISTVPTVVYRHRRHDASISSDYLRPTTFSDWISQSMAVFDAIARSSSAALKAHYLRQYLGHQWWSRAREFDRLTAAQAEQFQAFSAQVQERARLWLPPAERSLPLAALGVIARGRLASSTTGFNPLPERAVHDSDSLERALAEVESIELHDAADRDFVSAIVVHRLLDPIATGETGVSADAAPDVFDRVGAVIDRIGPPEFAPWILPSVPATIEGSGRQLAMDRVNAREPLPTVLDELSVSLRGIIISGSTQPALPVNTVARVELVLRSQSSRKVRTVPASWHGVGVVSWEGVVPATPEFEDEEWRVWIRFHRAFGTRDVLLPAEPRSETERLAVIEGSMSAAKAVLLRGKGLEFLLRRLPVPEGRGR